MIEPLRGLTPEQLQVLSDQALAGAGDENLKALLQEVESLRSVDVCRMSPGQLKAVERRLSALRGSGGFALQAAVLHHHLLPVSLEEEVKPYESMLNLGMYRAWLGDNGFDLVLHGHKHAAAAFFDTPLGTPLRVVGCLPTEMPILVSSAATANNERPTEIMRLIEIGDAHGSVRTARIWSIPPRNPGFTLSSTNQMELVGETYAMSDRRKSRARIFEGSTVDSVYDQLLVAFPSGSYTPIDDVMCRIADGKTARSLPHQYPVPEGEDNESWFTETVAWWQNPQPRLDPPQFNHGQRIYNYGHDLDQFDSALRELERRSTSRAVVMILDPRPASRLPHMMPAFCLLQLRVRDGRLDVIGYFRKQQMRAWWPINVGEMALLQERAVQRLGGLDPGELVTVSAIAIGGSDKPRVVVPRLDRWAQGRPEALWDLTLATFVPDHPRRESAIDDWERLFTDWRPVGPMEVDGVPVALGGLVVLADAIKMYNERFPSEAARQLCAELEDLSRINVAYWRRDCDLVSDDERVEAYRGWQPTAGRAIDRVMKLVGGYSKGTRGGRLGPGPLRLQLSTRGMR